MFPWKVPLAIADMFMWVPSVTAQLNFQILNCAEEHTKVLKRKPFHMTQPLAKQSLALARLTEGDANGRQGYVNDWLWETFLRNTATNIFPE